MTRQYDVSDSKSDYEDDPGVDMNDAVVRHMVATADEDNDLDNILAGIVDHEWDNGVLHFKVAWSTGDHSTIPYSMMKLDYPYESTSYIVEKKIGSAKSKHTSDQYTRWAKGFLCHCNRTMRHAVVHLVGIKIGITKTMFEKPFRLPWMGPCRKSIVLLQNGRRPMSADGINLRPGA